MSILSKTIQFILMLIFSQHIFADSNCYLFFGQQVKSQFFLIPNGCQSFMQEQIQKLKDKHLKPDGINDFLNDLQAKYLKHSQTSSNNESFYWEQATSPNHAFFQPSNWKTDSGVGQSAIYLNIVEDTNTNMPISANPSNLNDSIQYLSDYIKNPPNVNIDEAKKQANHLLQALTLDLQQKTLNFKTKSNQLTANNQKTLITHKANIDFINKQLNTTKATLIKTNNETIHVKPVIQKLKTEQQKIIEFNKSTISSTDQLLEKIKNLKVSPNTLPQIQKMVEKSLDSSQVGEGSLQIKAIEHLAQLNNSAVINDDIKSVYEQLVDRNGLVKKWLVNSSYQTQPVLQTNPNTEMGKTLRYVYNQALEYNTKSSRSNLVAEKSQFIQEWLLRADQAFSTNNLKIGNRYINRAQIFLDYENNHYRISAYHKYLPSDATQQILDVDNISPMDAYQFELYQITNRLMKLNYIRSNKTLLDQVKSHVENIKQLGTIQHKAQLQQYISQLETLWIIHDSHQSIN